MGVAGEDGFTIQSHGTNDAWQGLIIDTIQVHDWTDCTPETVAFAGATLFSENFETYGSAPGNNTTWMVSENMGKVDAVAVPGMFEVPYGDG